MTSTWFLILETDLKFVEKIKKKLKLPYQCHTFFEKVDHSSVRSSKLAIGLDVGLKPGGQLLLEARVPKSSVTQQNSTKISFVPDDSTDGLVHSS